MKFESKYNYTQENALETVVCKTSAIFSRGGYLKNIPIVDIFCGQMNAALLMAATSPRECQIQYNTWYHQHSCFIYLFIFHILFYFGLIHIKCFTAK